MNDIQSIQDFVMLAGSQVMTDSRKVAQHFGKLHKNVLRDIRKLLSQLPDGGRLNFEHTPYIDSQNGETYDAYQMTKDGFMLLVMGFTGKDRYSLNDLHRAAGGEAKNRPGYWLANQQTVDLLAELETAGIPAVSAEEGRGGGTYVLEPLVVAYASWISPKFHLEVINTFLMVKKSNLHHLFLISAMRWV